MDLNESIQTLIDTGKTLAVPQTVQKFEGGNVPYYMSATGPKACPELLYNEHAERPERIKQNVSVLDPASFCEYFGLFRDANSRIFAFEPEVKVIGVLDYHEGIGAARWGQHRLTLTLRHSPEWLRWNGMNNKQFTQQQFAEFLEQNAIDIMDPTPATMMEVARDLQATTEVEFGGGIRMNDGQVRFKYTETTKSSVGASQLAVPEQFTLSLPVFVGGDRAEMGALLRFRVKEGKLVIWYTLVRPEEVIRLAFLSARDEIAAALELTIINGNPA